VIVAVADTHALLWYLYSDSRLSNTARAFFLSAFARDDLIAVSSITMVEMVYLIERGRIASESLTRVANVLDAIPQRFIEKPVDLQIARALSRVDVKQIPDMPDRIVAATAIFLDSSHYQPRREN
jgi:PIN domain nuclease of toxin-antitoxin system